MGVAGEAVGEVERVLTGSGVSGRVRVVHVCAGTLRLEVAALGVRLDVDALGEPFAVYVGCAGVHLRVDTSHLRRALEVLADHLHADRRGEDRLGVMLLWIGLAADAAFPTARTQT